MVQMVVDQIPAEFKYCINYIKVFLSNPDEFAKKYPIVWSAFIWACTAELSPSQTASVRRTLARDALTLGKGPLIVVNYNLKVDCGFFYPRQFYADTSDQITISGDTMNAYEHGTGWKTFEGTLLHESIHWHDTTEVPLGTERVFPPIRNSDGETMFPATRKSQGARSESFLFGAPMDSAFANGQKAARAICCKSAPPGQILPCATSG